LNKSILDQNNIYSLFLTKESDVNITKKDLIISLKNINTRINSSLEDIIKKPHFNDKIYAYNFLIILLGLCLCVLPFLLTSCVSISFGFDLFKPQTSKILIIYSGVILTLSMFLFLIITCLFFSNTIFKEDVDFLKRIKHQKLNLLDVCKISFSSDTSWQRDFNTLFKDYRFPEDIGIERIKAFFQNNLPNSFYELSIEQLIEKINSSHANVQSAITSNIAKNGNFDENITRIITSYSHG